MTIAVVLSSSIGFRNSGMFSVDYAAYKYFNKHFPEQNLKFYVFHLCPESDYPYEELMPYSIYNKINNDNKRDLFCADMIVYWGDFNHNRHFIEQFVETYIFPDSDDIDGDRDLFYDLYFLEDAEDFILNKVITFGNSLMNVDNEEKFKTDRYAVNLRRLYKNMKMAMPRDIVSLEKAKYITDYRGNASQGCDPAFLLHKVFPTIKERDNSIGLFLGRRTEISLRDVTKIMLFAEQASIKIEWIPWMMNTESFLWRSIKNPRQAKNLFLHCLLAFYFAKKKPKYANDFTTLGRHNMIITDTYHLAINAIKDDVPVFCIGNDSIIYNTGSLDLSDKKKEVLFRMINRYNSYGEVTLKKLWGAVLNRDDQYLLTTSKNISKKLYRACKIILG